ncbi:quinone oxidoreductase family protein [Methylobacterium sp. Leaf118]|uniref:quinone oxidoreductase family protein n=1 Tax=Methylobacterium sp. Leaf118 TaxID=2876562 RepID=UPI001E338A3C|nr:zinc-binding dehydrogenase [Methylobacterium sp. Leaf118]
MKAVRFHETGGPDVLIYEDVPDPTPGPGQILIRVEAAGMNYADVMRRRGDDYPEASPVPFTLGIEVAGTVAALGEGVTAPAVGTPVLATPGAGGYAQYVAVPAAMVIPLPEGFDAVNAAALVAHGLTAAIALRKSGRMAEGETVLIEGAAGGLGSFFVQLAKLYGAGMVIGAASTPEKRAIAERLGADATVDYTAPGWAQAVKDLTGGRGVDLIMETAGGETVNEALDALAPFGRMVFLGQSSGRSAQIDPWRLTTFNQSVIGIYISAYAAVPNLMSETLNELVGFLMAGKLSIHVGKVMPLSHAAEAHRLLENRLTTGKVVLKPWDLV